MLRSKKAGAWFSCLLFRKETVPKNHVILTTHPQATATATSNFTCHYMRFQACCCTIGPDHNIGNLQYQIHALSNFLLIGRKRKAGIPLPQPAPHQDQDPAAAGPCRRSLGAKKAFACMTWRQVASRSALIFFGACKFLGPCLVLFFVELLDLGSL
ncbi:hypothetical protein K402DRAFT_143944 [Aulographum hederae CBS 113979]|uniref:Uncharacterized protein n=1 Tax=Aulographum hederae CBS 113979 TaxID=1176131 RepID=A0A6G1GUE4_9PEZI|nr:hypothetical protein K402DRAFT_143944 [Aulographum hederae CBS 113979]